MTDTIREDHLLVVVPALSRTFGPGEVQGWEFLAHGLMNRNWRLDTDSGTYAVKEITDVPLPKVRRNLSALAGLAGDGIPAPAPLAADTGDLVAEIDGHVM